MSGTSFLNTCRKYWKEALFYGTLFAVMLFFVLIQPFGEPPDESGRYLVVQYICLNGRLPHGADPAISLFGYGGSYAFQPILTYIIQGFLLRFLFFFCKDGYLLLLAARMVNVLFGMVMAVFVRKISKQLFDQSPWQWLFSIMVMFLPQSLFLHTYVNTDSMAMMSTAIMVYAWIRGMQTHWKRPSCILLAAGISLCALSYYNAYGFILCSIFLFCYTFCEKDPITGKWHCHTKELLQKGLLVSAIVLVCIGWWFVRNAVLYHGDFLGLQARAECTLLTATEQYNPLTKETIQNTGHSLWYMLTKTDFMELLTNSSIATFGPMSIVTYQHIYTIFKWFFVISGISFLVLPVKYCRFGMYCRLRPYTAHIQTIHRDHYFLYGNMIVCMIIPVFLCVFYSYTSDYQPQGRYILPMLIPFMYFASRGIRKLCGLLRDRWNVLPYCIMAFYFYALFITMWKVVFPVYYESSILYYLRYTL